LGPQVDQTPPAKGFLFRPSDHTYWLDGRHLPGCTTVIEDAGIYDLHGHTCDSCGHQTGGIPKKVLAKAAERGTKVHLATQYFDQGILDVDTVHPDLIPYVEAWGSFRLNERFIPDPNWLEVPTWHTKFLYGVTPDRYGFLGGQKAIVEIKCTYAVAKYWSIQTAAQAHALASQGVDVDPQTVVRLALKLNKDGTYTMDRHDKPGDFAEFMACLRVYGMKRKYK